MKYFIALLPLEENTKQITTFLKKWNHYIPKINVPPHITVKTQYGLTEDERWIETVKKVAKTFYPFFVTINKLSGFQNDSIIYLQVDSHPLKELHERIVKSLELYDDELEKWHEGDHYTPHLTLASLDLGYTQAELLEIKKETTSLFTSPSPFRVETISIFKKATEEGAYIRLIDIPLGK